MFDFSKFWLQRKQYSVLDRPKSRPLFRDPEIKAARAPFNSVDIAIILASPLSAYQLATLYGCGQRKVNDVRIKYGVAK